MKKVLLTGSAGFIGYHLCKQLLSNNFHVYGLDNLNDYYDIDLKKSRLQNIKDYLIANKLENKYFFHKCDLSNKEELKEIFSNNEFDIVIN
jgi:Nucleoside-diphosphate-sugar epimerases